MKPTKKAKKVRIEYEQVVNYLASYHCPSCKIIYKGNGPWRGVVRFRCGCGQELIVENV